MSYENIELAKKRINKDLTELVDSPIEGIGIASLDNDQMKYIVNIRIMEGIYLGYCIQILLIFSDSYPFTMPNILIFPNQKIDEKYHKHISIDYITEKENDGYFKKFNSNLNNLWKMGDTLKKFLIEVQNYLSDPHLPKNILPNKEQIEKLMKSMDNYKMTFSLNNNGEKIVKVHTWKNPYPEIYFNRNNIKNNEIKNENNKIDKIKENLNSHIYKFNYLEDPDISYGYPIKKKKEPIYKFYDYPKIFTFQEFKFISQKKYLDDYDYDFYYWMPIYIDVNHYNKNKSEILNTFKEIKSIISEKENIDFKPEYIFEIFPLLITWGVEPEGKRFSEFILCYFQLSLLFQKLCLEYEYDYIKYLNHQLNLIAKNDYDANESIIRDINDLFILLFFSTRNTHTDIMKKIWFSMYEEFLTRKIYSLFINEKNEMEKLIFKNIKNIKDITLDKLCIENLENNKNYKIRYIDNFIRDCKKYDIYNNLVNIISNDKLFLEKNNLTTEFNYYVKIFISQKMDKNFIKLFNDCSIKTKKNIVDIIANNLHFSEYFAKDNELEVYKDISIIEFLLNNKYIKNIDEIMDFVFNSMKEENEFFIITYFLRKKFEEKGFLEELEKNYGVYLNLEKDNIINEIKNKIKEINNYNDIFKYIGCEYGSDEDYLKALLKGYKRANKIENYKRNKKKR